MGVGKILCFSVLGVGAVALAPFTGGGSILGAATLGASLTGAGTIAMAVGAGMTGAVAGVTLSKKEDEEFMGGGSILGTATLRASLTGAETIAIAVGAGITRAVGMTRAPLSKKEEVINEEMAMQRIKAEKYEKALKEVISEFHGDKEYFDYIIASTAIGMSVANVDGEISEDELVEIDEFVGGIASLNYPKYVKKAISMLRDNPPTFNEAICYLEKVNSSYYDSIRDLIEIVMAVDGVIHEKEKAFLAAYNDAIKMIEYTPRTNDTNSEFLLEARERFIV